jgi:AraC-like DNA-binding protein
MCVVCDSTRAFVCTVRIDALEIYFRSNRMSDTRNTYDLVDEDPIIPIFKASTVALPVKDRFGAWMDGNPAESRLRSDDSVQFEAEVSGAALGPLILSGRRYPEQHTIFDLRQTQRSIRADGRDFFRFHLYQGGKVQLRTADIEGTWALEEIYFLDAAQPFDSVIEAGDNITLVVPREFLPQQTAKLHGRALSGSMGKLSADYLRAFYRNLPNLRKSDIPYVVQATLQLLTAAISPTVEMLRQASGPIGDALRDRVMRHIEAHLLDADLIPDRICKDVGLSRAKLYQLFEGSGGIMRQIQRMRLRRAYQMLADPTRPRVRIAEIAWANGFSNEKYFDRLFKAQFGHTPSETLEALRGSGFIGAKSGSKYRFKSADHPSGWIFPYGGPE